MKIFYIRPTDHNFSEKDIIAPNINDDSSFVFTSSNGSIFSITKNFSVTVTNYLTANQSCQDKGGYLAIIDTTEKQDIVQSLIGKHSVAFGTKKASFLLGKLTLIFILHPFLTFSIRSCTMFPEEDQ
jgi:hypothetical protein